MRLGRILLITGNPGKALEFQSLLPGVQLDHRSIDLIEIQSLSVQEVGHHKTIEALSKLSAADTQAYDAVLTDDTSLSFDAFDGGFPGSLIKFCLDALGLDGLVKLTEGKVSTALARCCLSLGLTQSKEVIQFEGQVQGKILPAQGTTGFGWDPIFYPNGSDLSYGQMSAAQKDSTSHRFQAAKQLTAWLNQEQ